MHDDGIFAQRTLFYTHPEKKHYVKTFSKGNK